MRLHESAASFNAQVRRSRRAVTTYHASASLGRVAFYRSWPVVLCTALYAVGVSPCAQAHALCAVALVVVEQC